MQHDVLLRALGDVLREERANTKSQLSELSDKVDATTSSRLIGTVVNGLLIANLSSIDRFCEAIMWRKAKALNRDAIPSVVRKTL